MDLSATKLVKYVSHKVKYYSSSRRYTKVLKTILARKRTSKLRISHNRSWNQDEDRCYIRVTHFNNMDLCNEINENSINEALLLIQLQQNTSHQNNASIAYCKDIGIQDSSPAAVDDLTPPATPFGNSVSFGFESNTILQNMSSSIQLEDLPLTPTTPSCESYVFNFQCSTVT